MQALSLLSFRRPAVIRYPAYKQWFARHTPPRGSGTKRCHPHGLPDVFSLREGAVTESSTNNFGSPQPIFRVKDMDTSIAYYLGALGFELRWRAGDGFACVARDKCSIFLTNDNQSQPRMWVWIGVEDVRPLHKLYVTSGARIRNPPENFEWALEMQVEDLDGNVLRIGSDPEKDKPLGVWRDADGIRWRHLGNQKYKRVG
jgi:catechol 2,3-dioxygenase-like lactoylglutathione lyase family enzyme